MPSFDIVSEVDDHELTNAIDQVNREISTRFDFKGSESKVTVSGHKITIDSGGEFQVKQVQDILYNKMAKRGLDIRCLELEKIEDRGKRAYQEVNVKTGLEKELAKKIIKLIKESKIKVQSAVQGEQVRVTGKKRDDLQQVISMLKAAEIDQPLQFTNFRD